MTALHESALVLAIALSTLALGWVIFRSWRGFWGSVWYELITDLISLFRGELKRDWTAELKLGLFVISSLVVAACLKGFVDQHFK